MAWKVKSIDKLEKVASGVVVYAQALVTFNDGIVDKQESVQSEVKNPSGMTANALKLWLKTSLEGAIVKRCASLDAETAVATEYAQFIPTIWNDLVALGVTLLLAFMLWLTPVVGWAGSLYPDWSDSVNTLNAGTGAATSGTTLVPLPTYLGTIDCSGYYAVAVWVNLYEDGDAPNGSAGVSVYALTSNSGTSTYQLPFSVVEVSAADYTTARVSGSGNGVTKFLGLFENVPYLAIGVGHNNSADVWSAAIRYKRMKGTY